MSGETATQAEPGGSMLTVPKSAPRGVAVEVRDLHKTFRIPTQRLDTLKERAVRPFSKREHWELQALRGIGFDVPRGDFFGIVGRNGSGKSTLLKLLASIYRADSGTIRIGGRVAPCIELGVGFNPELAAHENVVLNGVMMGLSPREARRRFDEIVDFAELGEFTEMKLKNYSSGMLVRLGFSLMTHVDADVLLIDEVLAVGDASFQQKCFDAFARLHAEGRTIILVTHDMSAVERHCGQAILLENGAIERSGVPSDVTRRYLELNFGERRGGADAEDVGGEESRDARFVDVSLARESGERANAFEQGESIRIEIEIEAKRRIEQPLFGFQIVNADELLVFAPYPFPLADGGPLAAGERIRVSATIANPMAAGHYFVNCVVGRPGREPRPLAFRKNAADFIVYGTRRFRGLVGLDHSAEARRVER